MVKTYTEEAAERAAMASKEAGHGRLRKVGCLGMIFAVFVLPHLWRLGGWVSREAVPAANNAWRRDADKLAVAPQPEKRGNAASELSKAPRNNALAKNKPRSELSLTEALGGHWRAVKNQVLKKRDDGNLYDNPWDAPVLEEIVFKSGNGADHYFDVSTTPHRHLSISANGNEEMLYITVPQKNEKTGRLRASHYAPSLKEGPITGHDDYYLSPDKTRILYSYGGQWKPELFQMWEWVDAKTGP